MMIGGLNWFSAFEHDDHSDIHIMHRDMHHLTLLTKPVILSGLYGHRSQGENGLKSYYQLKGIGGERLG